MANSVASQPALDLEQRAAELLPPVGLLPLPFDRIWQVLRHYRWSQLARRGWKQVHRRFAGSKLISLPRPTGRAKPRERSVGLASLADVQIRWRCERRRQICDLTTGSVTLMNERRELGSPLAWKRADSPDTPQLWRFQLHYHEFLLALAGDPPVDDRGLIWPAIESWMDAYELGIVCRNDDAWHPYCISRRLPVWIWLWQVLEPPAASERILNSFRDQATYLAANLEFDPGGNHLLENLSALGLAASFLDDPRSERWLKLSERRLRAELRRQILDHGEHFERTPAYHCQVTANLMTLAVATREIRPDFSNYCAEQASAMLKFIVQIVHADGEIPLFGDSGFGEAPGTSALRELASLAGIEWVTVHDTRCTGSYWAHRLGRSSIIFDAGPVGPPELPAHSHGDLLGFEASVDGHRWFGDSGNYNYEADSMRRYCRSSAAHNVVVVDDREQCDTWSKFRMGRRGAPEGFQSGRRGGAEWAAARHDAYHTSGVRYLDRLFVAWGKAWLCGDFAHTRARPKLDGYLHVAEDVSVESVGERRFELSACGQRRKLEFFGVEEVQVGTSWYCPAFGERIRRRCFVYRQNRGPVTPLGWLLDEADSRSSAEVVGHRLVLRLQSGSFEWSFQ